MIRLVLVVDPNSQTFIPAGPMSTRRRAREIVLQMLYEADVNGTRPEESAIKFIQSRLQGRKGLTQFAGRLLIGTLQHRDQIDSRLKLFSTHWALARMPVTDRNILRLGGYEILFGGTPVEVAVSEAISLAKRYGDKNSPRFINGVLDRLYKESLKDESPKQDSPGGGPESTGEEATADLTEPAKRS